MHLSYSLNSAASYTIARVLDFPVRDLPSQRLVTLIMICHMIALLVSFFMIDIYKYDTVQYEINDHVYELS